MNIAVIVGIADTGGLYQQQSASTMLNLPSEVARLFTGTLKRPSQLMDEAANKGSETGTKIQERAPPPFLISVTLPCLFSLR